MEIDDEMMIFCVLTTAATIIQKHYRGYQTRKWVFHEKYRPKAEQEPQPGTEYHDLSPIPHQ